MYHISIADYDKEANAVRETRFCDMLCDSTLAIKAFKDLAKSGNRPIYLWTTRDEGQEPVILSTSSTRLHLLKIALSMFASGLVCACFFGCAPMTAKQIINLDIELNEIGKEIPKYRDALKANLKDKYYLRIGI